jgi:acyl-CoA thioesterase FadM
MAPPLQFGQHLSRVPASWIDYNGHMNDAAYAQVITDANELFLEALGLSADYRQSSGCSMYTVELTIKFVREAGLDDLIRAETQLASHDSKRVRLRTSLLAEDLSPLATAESLYLHVDTATGRVSVLPDSRLFVLEQVQRAHDALSLAR